MKRVDLAVACFKQGFSCSQAILSTYGPLYGLNCETALRVSRGFGGGMGALGLTCGALTGAFMVLGLMYDSAEPAAKEKVVNFIAQISDRFVERHGAMACRELIGCDLKSEAGRRRFQELNLIETHCVKFVRDAAEFLEGIVASGLDPLPAREQEIRIEPLFDSSPDLSTQSPRPVCAAPVNHEPLFNK